jgi:hypothetical protein
MKAFLFLLLGGIAFADLPRLTIERGGHRQDLRVDELDVTVRVEGDLVETRMSLNFLNETSLNQEGEFRLPLPEGASVNHYALEVNGKMREATVVEKEQARRAYETIKARNIDPGLVEKMEGNVYRTRIFPVLPKQGKRVSIGYVQPLEKVGDRMLYRLPFGVAEKIGKFHLKIEGDLTGVTPKMTGEAKLEEKDNGFSFSSENSPIEGDLVLGRKAAGGGFSGEIREVNGESFAYLTGTIPPELFKQMARNPRTLTVLWDASANGYARDLKAEVKFLEKLVKELGEVSVRLMAVHGEVEDLGEFKDSKKLRAAVEGIFHDGAADWRKVDFAKLEGERVLLFGGDESAFPLTVSQTKGVFQLVRSGGGVVDMVLAEMAKRSGGGVTDAANPKAGKDLELRVMGLGGTEESYCSEIVDGQVRIFAKMRKGDADEVVVSLGRGGEVMMPVSVKLKRAEGGNALRYLWAQRRLEEMVRSGSFIVGGEKAAIIAHCKTYGLVSDFTSFIVLERMQDHLEFRIPPPEPELMAEYQRGMEQRGNLWRFDHLAWSWKNRKAWHGTDFPWAEAVLLPRYARVKKWTEAQTSVFEKGQLAQTDLAEFMAWKKQAEEVILEKSKVTDREKFIAWEARIKSMVESGVKLGTEGVKLPVNGEFGVSVRGLVQEPQTMNLKSGATLREALRKAGGLHSAASESRVAIYRSGRRSVYNLLSEDYEDVKLLPGDMVVAMAEFDHYGDVDPFFAAEPDPAKQPAITEGDIPLGDPSPTIAGADGGAPALVLPPLLQGEVKEIEAPVANKELIEEMLKSDDPWASYRKRRSDMGGGGADFAKVAGKLYERNEPGKARRVLANLYGRSGFHVPSLRAAAYWMMQFKDYEGAGVIFELIALKCPEDAMLALDVMRLNRISDARFGKLSAPEALQALADPKNTVPAEMVMMERNRFQTAQLDNLTKQLPADSEVFPSDIRIVASFSHPMPGTHLSITDPTGRISVWSGTSLTGGRLVQGNGVAEFMLRHAIPGDYRLGFDNATMGTCQIEVFLNWGKENETRRMFTLAGDGKSQLIEAGVVTFELGRP